MSLEIDCMRSIAIDKLLYRLLFVQVYLLNTMKLRSKKTTKIYIWNKEIKKKNQRFEYLHKICLN